MLLCDCFLHRDILHLAAYDFKALYVSLVAGSEIKNLQKLYNSKASKQSQTMLNCHVFWQPDLIIQ